MLGKRSRASTVSKVIPSKRKEVTNQMGEDFSQPMEDSDVILLVEDSRLHTNSGLLSAYSPVFRRMFFGGDWKEVRERSLTIHGYTLEEVREFLRCITPRPHFKPIDGENVAFLCKLSEEYQIDQLRGACSEYLKSNWAGSGQTCMGALVLAWRYKLKEVARVALETSVHLEDPSLLNPINPVPKYVGLQTDWKFVEVIQRIWEMRNSGISTVDRVCKCGRILISGEQICGICGLSYVHVHGARKCYKCKVNPPFYKGMPGCGHQQYAFCATCVTESKTCPMCSRRSGYSRQVVPLIPNITDISVEPALKLFD